MKRSSNKNELRTSATPSKLKFIYTKHNKFNQSLHIDINAIFLGTQ